MFVSARFILGTVLAQSETSTATWAVLTLVVTFLIAGVLAVYRVMSVKLSDANKRVEKTEDNAQSARHNEIKTMIRGVNKSVDSVGVRVKEVEDRVGHLEIGHAEIKAQIDQLGAGS